MIPADSDVGATTNSCKRGTITLPHLSPVKKSKRCITNSPPPPQSTTTISDLPDCIIFEILCRLPSVGNISRCKCVSKRWYDLLSRTYFVSRFLSRFGTPTKPYMTNHVVWCYKDNKLIPLTSYPFIFRDKFRFTLRFLPIFKDLTQRFNIPIVEATFRDLVLCCATKYYQRDYYICSPWTKKWVALPPTPRVHKSKVPVGFICDPYYVYQGNADYRWAVVRIVPYSTPRKHGFSLEIFSSEIGEWREHELNIPPSINYFDRFINWRPGFAFNGKLYWYSYKRVTLELDPFNISGIRYIRVNEAPNLDLQLGVCQERLRMYQSKIKGSISIWELRENSGKVEWCLIFDRVRIPMSDMVSEDPKITQQKSGELDVLGFLPDNEDIIYLKFPEQIVMCNLRENTLEKSAFDPPINIDFDFSGYVGWFGLDRAASIYTYVLPWWPTPVPRINKPKASKVKVLKRGGISLVQQQESWIIPPPEVRVSWNPDPCQFE